jgi:hypothetical protein
MKIILEFFENLEIWIKMKHPNVWNQIKFRVNTYFMIYLLMI